MPTNLFLKLSNEKKGKITDVSILEFGEYGYSHSSTNRIVKNADISKGSLFKYFPSKEDLYFYILDSVTAELLSSLEKEMGAFSTELFTRVIEYAAMEFSWYIRHPEKAKLIIAAFTKSDAEIYQKTVKRYRTQEQDVYDKLLEDIDTAHFRWDKKKSINILKWFLKGFNEDFKAQANRNASINEIRNTYVASLWEHMEMLQKGLMK